MIAAANEGITTSEWGVSCCCFALGTVMRSGLINQVTGNESFLIGIIGFAAYVPMMFLYSRLASKYPSMNLFQMAEAAMGKVFGKLVSALYLIFFLSLASHNLMEIGNFVSSFLLQGSPYFFVVAVSSLAAAYILWKGVASFIRIQPLILIIAMFLLVCSLIQSLGKMDLGNLLPVFQLPITTYVRSAVVAGAVPFGEVLTMFSILPLVRGNNQTQEANQKRELSSPVGKGMGIRPWFYVALFTCVVVTVIHLRDISIMGKLLTYVALPSVEVYRMVDSFSSIARSESLHAVILIMLALIKTVFCIYAVCQGLAEIFGIRNLNRVYLPASLLVSVSSVILRRSDINNIYYTVYVLPLFWLGFELVPTAVMAVIPLRRADGGRAYPLNHPDKSAEPPQQNCGFVGDPGDLSGTPGNA
ncbi:MAG: GerAB/ArcD/ProY family transporter [Oscillospiraceae bacterium]|jgi:spore germination protein KB|nr:GerAB/ArcD/ProY family transporter [Oscillospiraceae bacterium]